MAITAFQATELVTRANVNSRLTEVDNALTAVNNKFPVSIANGGTGGTTATAARTNLDVMKAVNIYTNYSGAQGTISFDTGYTAAEFSYLEIYYFVEATSGTWLRNSIKMRASTGTNANMVAMYYDGATFRCYTRSVTINDTGLSLASNTRGQYSFKTSSAVSTTDNLYITNIVGYKY